MCWVSVWPFQSENVIRPPEVSLEKNLAPCPISPWHPCSISIYLYLSIWLSISLCQSISIAINLNLYRSFSVSSYCSFSLSHSVSIFSLSLNGIHVGLVFHPKKRVCVCVCVCVCSLCRPPTRLQCARSTGGFSSRPTATRRCMTGCTPSTPCWPEPSGTPSACIREILNSPLDL